VGVHVVDLVWEVGVPRGVGTLGSRGQEGVEEKGVTGKACI
jgi:hypothetical protein